MCTKCLSLERHRIIRSCYNSIIAWNPNFFSSLSCLHFAKDISIDPNWFHIYEHSEYGGHNSIDLLNIKSVASCSLDWVILNHVLEHLSSEAKAFNEIFRILSADGVAQFSVPQPVSLFETTDWGFPDPLKIDHYREYGADIMIKLKPIFSSTGTYALVAIGQDPCALVYDYKFFASSSLQRLEEIFVALRQHNIPSLAF